MKIKILLLFLLGFLGSIYAQSEADKKVITKIENEILNKNIKIETFQENDETTIIIYSKRNVPILVEKQTGKFLHTSNIIGNQKIEKDIQTFINAKFYIQNWKKNTYIRVGEIIKIEEKLNSTTVMPIDCVFEYDKVEIENAIAKKPKP